MQSMQPFGQRVPDVDDASAAAGERLTTRDQSTRCRPGDSLASEKQRIARRSFSRGFRQASMKEFVCSKRVVLARIAQFARIESALSVHTTRTPSLVPQNERQRELQHR